MPRQFGHQGRQSAHRASASADHRQDQKGDRETAKDQNHDLNNVGQRYGFQTTIQRIEQRESGQHGHAREHTEASHRLDRQRPAIQYCGQVHCGEQENPEHRHDRFDAVTEPSLEKLRHRINAAFQENRQEKRCHNDEHERRLPFISGNGETDHKALSGLSDNLLCGDVCGNQ